MTVLLGPRYALQAALVLLLVLLYWRNREGQRTQYFGHSESGHGDARLAWYPGVPKASGSSYSRIMVVPKLVDEDVSWISHELPGLETAIYEVDNPYAEFRVPDNKGHEAMVYLTYIIDHYNSLPDTVIFVHAHRNAWHNNVLLNLAMPDTINRLRDDRVARQGYMNLRCHLDPGCPDWIHLDRAEVDFDYDMKPEEQYFSSKLFEAMFPGHRPPPVLSQPCCAQFAVSGDRIRDNPRDLYVHLREWLLETSLTDENSGRIFEYIWQYLFTRNAEHCPSMNACYCDGFGICFGNAQKLDEWLKKLRAKEIAEQELEAAEKEERLGATYNELKKIASRLNQELDKERDEAYRRGEKEENRAMERERT
jgi:hypothetical protein